MLQSFLNDVHFTNSNQKHKKISILGLENTGKTSILNHIKGQSLPILEPTVSFNLHKTRVRSQNGTNNQYEYYEILDASGSHVSIQYFWRSYIREAVALIYVVDVLNLDNAGRELIELSQLITKSCKESKKIPIVILLNKVDLLEKSEIPNTYDFLVKNQLKKLFKDHMLAIQTTSTQTGEGLKNLLLKVDKLIGQANTFTKQYKSQSPLKKFVEKPRKTRNLQSTSSKINRSITFSRPVSSTPKKMVHQVQYKLKDHSITEIPEENESISNFEENRPKFRNRFKKLHELNPTYLKVSIDSCSGKIESAIKIYEENRKIISSDSGYSRSNADSSCSRNTSGESREVKIMELVDRLQIVTTV